MTTTAVSRRRLRALPSSTLPRWATPPQGWQPYAIFLGLPLGDVVIGVLWSFAGAALDIDIYMFFPG